MVVIFKLFVKILVYSKSGNVIHMNKSYPTKAKSDTELLKLTHFLICIELRMLLEIELFSNGLVLKWASRLVVGAADKHKKIPCNLSIRQKFNYTEKYWFITRYIYFADVMLSTSVLTRTTPPSWPTTTARRATA